MFVFTQSRYPQPWLYLLYSHYVTHLRVPPRLTSLKRYYNYERGTNIYIYTDFFPIFTQQNHPKQHTHIRHFSVKEIAQKALPCFTFIYSR